MGEFPFVFGLVWNPHRSELLATAVPLGRQQPDLSINHQGELALLRYPVDSGPWERIYEGYSRDAAFSPAAGYVVHTGRGVS